MEAYITLMEFQRQNPKIFDGLKVPQFTGDNGTLYTLDRETLINTIVLECGEFELLYNNPLFMQFAIKIWSDSNYYKWIELLKTMHYEYNPIHNYDRTEEHVFQGSRDTKDESSSNYEQNLTKSTTDNTKRTDNEVRTPDLSYSDNGNKNSNGTRNTTGAQNMNRTESNEVRDGGTDKDTHFVSAFNEPAPTVASTDDHKVYGKTTDTTVTVKGNSTVSDEEIVQATDITNNTRKESGTEKRDLLGEEKRVTESTDGGDSSTKSKSSQNEKTDNLENIRAHGNIGVMSTQQMIKLQREVVEFNLYNYIATDFLKNFCLLVY